MIHLHIIFTINQSVYKVSKIVKRCKLFNFSKTKMYFIQQTQQAEKH